MVRMIGPPDKAGAVAPRAERCRFCGSPRLFEVRCERGPHHARRGCSDCVRFNGYVAAPWTRARAAAFVMPFGKHKGRRLDRVPVGYLRWLAENTEGNPAVAAAILLDEGRADR